MTALIGNPAPVVRAVPHDESQLEPGDWFACDFPERPVDLDHTVFLSDCYPCRLALRAAVVNGAANDQLIVFSLGWGVR